MFPVFLCPASDNPTPQSGISLMLEAGHEIVCVADDNHVPMRHFLAPFLGPQIENIMQIHVG